MAAPTTFAITHFLVNDNCLITVRVDIRFGEGPGESSVVYYPIVATRPNMALLCTRQCLISKSSVDKTYNNNNYFLYITDA